MPAVIGRSPPRAQPRPAPRRVALAVQPELERETIPSRVTLDANAPPFAGELREEQTGRPLVLVAGGTLTLATLRRPWNYVGFACQVGALADATGTSLRLRILGRGVNGLTPPVALVGPGPFAFVGFIVGATCELVIVSTLGVAVPNVRGAIWGMSER